MVLLVFEKEKHGGNQVMIYWIINTLTRILLMTRIMKITINRTYAYMHIAYTHNTY